MGPEDLPVITESEVLSLMTPREVVDVLAAALISGIEPEDDPERGAFDMRAGQMLLMPTEIGSRAGIKVATVAPGNAGTALPRIQGLFLLFDADTLRPLSVIDGIALTTLRTPAMSTAAVRARLVGGTTPLHIVIFGTGPQGTGHAVTVADLVTDGRGIASIVYIVRTERPLLPEMPLPEVTAIILAGTSAADDALRRADVVVCATTARTALFDSELLGNGVIVLAVGSHEPDKRELDGVLLGRSTVIVEDIRTALREAGDVVLAIQEGHLSPDDLVSVGAAVEHPERLDATRPLVFKSTGMAWEDVVVATRVDELWRARAASPGPALDRRSMGFVAPPDD